MAFTGQVLRFDQDAYWGLGIGASIASRVPVIGPWAVNLMLGGPIIAGATLSRFFAVHVFLVPGLLIAFVGVHLLMVLKLGVNEWPMPGRIVRRATYMQEYHELTHKEGVPFVPYAVWKDVFFSGFHSSFDCRLRSLFWPIRSERPAGPDDYSDRAAPGFLLLVALCCPVFPATVGRNADTYDWARNRNRASYCCFPLSPAKGRRAGSAGPLPFLRFCWLR